jgi:hypothetical protein
MLVEGDSEKENVEEEEELKRKEIDALKARYAVFVTQGRRVLTQAIYPGMMPIRHLCQELSLQIDLRNEKEDWNETVGKPEKKADIYAYGTFNEFFLFFFLNFWKYRKKDAQGFHICNKKEENKKDILNKKEYFLGNFWGDIKPRFDVGFFFFFLDYIF